VIRVDEGPWVLHIPAMAPAFSALRTAPKDHHALNRELANAVSQTLYAPLEISCCGAHICRTDAGRDAAARSFPKMTNFPDLERRWAGISVRCRSLLFLSISKAYVWHSHECATDIGPDKAVGGRYVLNREEREA
jgi:hypothetical protein